MPRVLLVVPGMNPMVRPEIKIRAPPKKVSHVRGVFIASERGGEVDKIRETQKGAINARQLKFIQASGSWGWCIVRGWGPKLV